LSDVHKIGPMSQMYGSRRLECILCYCVILCAVHSAAAIYAYVGIQQLFVCLCLLALCYVIDATSVSLFSVATVSYRPTDWFKVIQSNLFNSGNKAHTHINYY